MSFFKDRKPKRKLQKDKLNEKISSLSGSSPIEPNSSTGHFLQGNLLVATTQIQQPEFSHAVIFVASHDDFGAMGLIINKPLKTKSPEDILKNLDVEKGPNTPEEIDAYYGGPVDPTRGFVMHSDDYATKNTVKFGDGICISSEKQVLEDYVQGKGPKEVMIIMGYAGWVKGQVESEVDEGAWISVPAKYNLIFETDNTSKWQKSAKDEGIDIKKVVPIIGNA